MSVPNEDDWVRAAKICREVAELPDRTSPDENADFMLVTGDELQPMLAAEFALMRLECEGEREARHKCEAALRGRDAAMGVLFERLNAAGIDCSDLIP